jgi:hypothetical protein
MEVVRKIRNFISPCYHKQRKFFFFVGRGGKGEVNGRIRTQGFVFARQSLLLKLYLQPFYSGYFGDRVSLFVQAVLDCNFLTLGIPL